MNTALWISAGKQACCPHTEASCIPSRRIKQHIQCWVYNINSQPAAATPLDDVSVVSAYGSAYMHTMTCLRTLTTEYLQPSVNHCTTANALCLLSSTLCKVWPAEKGIIMIIKLCAHELPARTKTHNTHFKAQEPRETQVTSACLFVLQSSRRAARLREWLSLTGVQRGLVSLGADLVSKWGWVLFFSRQHLEQAHFLIKIHYNTNNNEWINTIERNHW